MIRSLLVANRAECACRIMRTARAAGLRTVAIHSEGDGEGMWVRMANEAHCIGPDPAARSYLDIDAILAAARRSRVDAVHPGYGLLSENAEFAKAVRTAGLIFVGPSVDVIACMADKVAARLEAEKAGIAVLRGTPAPLADPAEALAAANEIGWPVVVKAVFGGGGKGLRVAKDESDLPAAYDDATREAWFSFGRPDVFVEAWLPAVRHVEVQILGDRHGNVVHLGDRDCTSQRRRQKLVEEAPAPELSGALRKALADAAIRLARGVRYEGAGTVEFLVEAESGAFHFLEMNTRLQVEHAVTECVTGLDLVAEQLRIADGAPLGFGQEEIVLRGHAIEARIIAEEPGREFRPEAGKLEALAVPRSPGVRCDFGVAVGDRVSPFYDSLLGKVVAWGEDRESARRRLRLALSELEVRPMARALVDFIGQWLDHPDFIACTHDTGSIESEAVGSPESREESASVASDAQPAAGGAARLVRIPQGERMRGFAIHSDLVQSRHEPFARGGAWSGRAHDSSGHRDTLVRAPMDAQVIAIAVAKGESVARGDRLVTLEAMKMEVAVRAPRDGTVAEVLVADHEVVSSGAAMIALDASDE